MVHAGRADPPRRASGLGGSTPSGQTSPPPLRHADTKLMDDHGNVRAPRCRKCARASVLILDGVYYCSEHGLTVVLARLEEPDRVSIPG